MPILELFCIAVQVYHSLRVYMSGDHHYTYVDGPGHPPPTGKYGKYIRLSLAHDTCGEMEDGGLDAVPVKVSAFPQ